MSFLRSKKAGRRIGAIVLAAAVGGAFACNADRGDVVFQVGDFVFEFLVDAQLAGGFPVGVSTVSEFAIGATDLTDPDAFIRATSEFGYSWEGANFDYDPGARIASNDPRSPVLGSSGTEVSTNCRFGQGTWWGGTGGWDFYCFIDGLKPNTDYSVLFYRYALTVNGDLDHAEMLLTGNVTAPDALTPLGGVPGGYPTEPCDFNTGRPTFTVGVTGNQNPLNLGYVTSSGDGGVVFDCLIGSGGFWADEELLDPAESPHGPNTLASYDLPRYNYIVIYEGVGTPANPIPPGPAVMRFQVSVDIDASGNPIPNSFAPFPPAALDVETLVALPCCAGQASGLELEFENLEALSGAVYQVWLWNEETDALISPSGNWEATDSEGTVVNSADNVSVFPSDAGWSHMFTTSDALAGEPVGPYTHVFLSIESSGASAPSGVQPLWAQYTDMAGVPDDPFQWSFLSPADMPFGMFGSGDPTEFMGVGIGEAGFWGQQEGVSDLLIVNYRNLQLPPEGYFYEAWMIEDDGTVVNVGELLTTFEEEPPYSSLRDVDVNPDLSGFISTDGLILRSETRTQLVCPSDAGGCVDSTPFYDFMEYRLTLSPKSGTGVMPPTTVLGAPVPETVKARKPSPEPAGQ